ncbi:flagellin hook IN motif-containing protein [Viridibacillus sp. FSL R5-0888]|uniref:flagellin hook IN motif-containing protein n=1 Tax=Viridibacillus sp. FSL R5-0888 TaxID=2921663 RepID=UPI0030FA20E5
MGKFNLKFVKPVASLAIGAAVLTGSFAVSGAADTAFAKAATVKVSKGKLVSAKSGKAVKGYKSYKGVLYKNGKKFTGLYKNTYYKSGKKGTGLYKNVYYKAGKKGSGWVGSGSSKKWYQDGKLLTGLGKNSGKLFIKGKYANGIQTYKGVEKLYKNGVVVKTVVDAAKAINNTTVEVTFAEAQKANDISAGRFVIDGLEVTNAAIKQSDDKVIVLTTAAQTGGKTYTVALDGVKSRTFKGVSNVLPTAITNLTPSVQGVIGKQVTVKSQVEVPAGQSKEGIAVTFSITNSADTSVGNFGKKIVAEAFTDANGVASYSYTQYVAGTEDVVEAYPTGNASVKSTAAIVYWGNTERLTVSEVTTGATLANGAKKVYKVNAQNYSVANKGTSSEYKYVNVAFAENVNVTPEKLVRGINVTDTGIAGTDYPYQVTTGGFKEVRVKLDANNAGTFTLTGANASATPIVFVDAANAGKLDPTELQAKAPTVKFDLSHTLGLAVKAEGVQNAAAINSNGTGNGGREYTVTVTDKEGKLAPAGTKAYVTFASGSLSSDRTVNIDGKLATIGGSYEITVEKDGKASFTLTGNKDAYATPTIYLDNGATNGKLDASDLQTVGETTYFVNAVINNSDLKITNSVTKKEVTSVAAGTPATFTYQSLDQNGFPYYAGNGYYEVTFEVVAQFGDVTVTNAAGNTIETVKQGTTKSIKVNAAKGVAVINVSSSTASTIGVQASASQVSLPNASATVTVTGKAAVTLFTGTSVAAFAPNDKVIYLKNATETEKFSYDGADFFDQTNKPIDETTFLNTVKVDGNVTYKKLGDTKQFYIVTPGSGAALSTLPTTPAEAGVNTYDATVKTAYVAATAEKYAKVESKEVSKTNYSTGSLKLNDVTGTTGEVVIAINGTDNAGAIADKINNAATALKINATVVNDRIVLTSTDLTKMINILSDTTSLFAVQEESSAVAKAATPAVYKVDLSALPTITAGKEFTVNGVTYKAVTSGGTAVNNTFNVTGTLATDIASLASLINNKDTTFSVDVDGTTNTTINLTQRTAGTGSQAAAKVVVK